MCPILARYNLLYFKIKPINYILNNVYNEGCTLFVVIYGGGGTVHRTKDKNFLY